MISASAESTAINCASNSVSQRRTSCKLKFYKTFVNWIKCNKSQYGYFAVHKWKREKYIAVIVAPSDTAATPSTIDPSKQRQLKPHTAKVYQTIATPAKRNGNLNGKIVDSEPMRDFVLLLLIRRGPYGQRCRLAKHESNCIIRAFYCCEMRWTQKPISHHSCRIQINNFFFCLLYFHSLLPRRYILRLLK